MGCVCVTYLGVHRDAPGHRGHVDVARLCGRGGRVGQTAHAVAFLGRRRVAGDPMGAAAHGTVRGALTGTGAAVSVDSNKQCNVIVLAA